MGNRRREAAASGVGRQARYDSSQVGVGMVREHSEPAVEADQIWSGLAYGMIGVWWFAASLRLRLSYRR